MTAGESKVGVVKLQLEREGYQSWSERVVGVDISRFCLGLAYESKIMIWGKCRTMGCVLR